MSNFPVSHTTLELDAKNRAANYLHHAQEAEQQHQQQIAQHQSAEFQQLLWLKSLEQSHARELLSAEHRQALELEERKHRAAIELRQFEIAQQRTPLRGLDAPEKPKTENFWESKLFITLLTISVPIILTFLLREDRRPVSSSRKRHGRHRTWK